MRMRLRWAFDAALESFWFLPLLMVAVSQSLVLPAMLFGADPASWAAAAGLDALAERIRALAEGLDPDGARDVLGMVAGGMITTVSIVFSLSFVALTLTSQQIGPRIIDFWLRSNATQALLGLSLAAFFAALSGLLAMTQTSEDGRVALMAVAFAAVLGSLALVAVVLFATRMSEAIRADATVARIGDAFVTACRAGKVRMGVAEADAAAALEALAEAEGVVIRADAAGYLGDMDLDALAGWAGSHGLRLIVLPRENDHVLPGRPLARVLGQHGDPSELETALRGRLALTSRRRRSGVADFEGDALAEVALRALSPSINDPFTAMACIDRIAEGCCVLARLGPPSRLRWADGGGDGGAPGGPDDGGKRVAIVAAQSCGAAWLAPRLLHPVLDAGRDKAVVLERAAQALSDIARIAWLEEDRAAVRRLLDRVKRAADALADPDDRVLVRDALADPAMD
ncbi:MAG: hypothetical protein CML46_03080 [Rhodobacteraceae bacterium]|nr:hypothetical protein [Paracoccaceae bacterium]